MPLDHETALADARRFRGGLGAVSWAVVKALRASGTDEGKVKQVLDVMVERFPETDPADAAVLCRVLAERIGEP